MLSTLTRTMRVLAGLLVLAATTAAQAPPPDARMMRGDDVFWADPNYDDSHWELIPAQRFTRWQEFQENRLWIRSRLEIPPGADRWALVVRCLCEVYLAGVKLGRGMTLEDKSSAPVVLWLPRGMPPGPALLAVRYSLMPGHEVIAAHWPNGHPRLVPQQSLAPTLAPLTNKPVTPFFVSLVLTAVLAGLWGQRFDTLTKLICAYLVITGPGALPSQDWGWMSAGVRTFWTPLVSAPLPAIVLAVMALLVEVPLRARWLAPFVALLAVSRGLFLAGFWSESPPGWMPLAAYLYPLPVVIASAMGTCFLYKARRLDLARQLLIGVALLTLVLSVLGRITIGSLVMPGGIRQLRGAVSWDASSPLAFGVLAAVYLVRRARERRADEDRMRGELEAARSVQSLLLGQALPAGVEAVYYPASEVGGDFYQAWQTGQGTMLVVGDVSGKGLQAAMTVATIVGAIRRSHDLLPGELLGAINEAMQGQGGFVTCCCVLAGAEQLRIASAGHPAPYLDGVELPIEPGLPLGVISGVSYDEVRAPRPALLTLVSDGVLEAANPSGELFGFERTRQLSLHPAKEIAQAARDWGQTDDISVIHLRQL